MHVTGLACPGGYIATRMFFYTDNETGYTDNYAGNSFDIHLYNYDWDEEPAHFSQVQQRRLVLPCQAGHRIGVAALPQSDLATQS